MRPLDPNEHRQYWEVIGLDILLMLCVAVPVAGNGFYHFACLQLSSLRIGNREMWCLSNADCSEPFGLDYGTRKPTAEQPLPMTYASASQ